MGSCNATFIPEMMHPKNGRFQRALGEFANNPSIAGGIREGQECLGSCPDLSENDAWEGSDALGDQYWAEEHFGFIY